MPITRMPIIVHTLLWLALAVGCSPTTPTLTSPPPRTPAATTPPLTPTLAPLPSASVFALTPSTTATSQSTTPTPASLSTPTPGATNAPPAALHLVGYFFGADRNDHVADIDATQLTDVIYAFADATRAGQCASINATADQANFPQLRQLKQQHPPLRTLISIGGYSHSAYFSDAALSADSRRRFVQSCVQFMQQHGLDGIDVDWELPVSGGQAGNVHRPQDKQNFTALLAEFRRQLDALGASDNRHYLLSIAGPAGGASEYATMELGAIYQYLDWINLETYAYNTASSPLTNFNSPLFDPSVDSGPGAVKRSHYSADAAVRAYLAAGVPASKIVLGVPFYGRGWQGVPGANNGLYQPNAGAAMDARVPNNTWKDGAIFYRDLVTYYIQVYTRYWQDEAKVPWLYNATTSIMVTYEDPESLGIKADYVRSNRLGGMMIWHLSADDVQHSLLSALHARLFP